MKQSKSRAAFLVVAIILLGVTYLPLLANERTLDAFAREDGVFENLTAIYLFIASVLFAAGFFRFRKSSWVLKLSYVGLALLFFLGAGEEVSWGERIFHWDDHNYIRGINVQGELTVHNLKYFQGDEAVIPLSASQIFTAFAFILAVVIPLVCKFSPKAKELLTPIIPVLPLDLSLFVVATYIFQKSMLRILRLYPVLYHHSSMPIPQGVHEIREHGYAFALLISTIFYFLREKDVKLVEDTQGSKKILTHPGLSVSLHAGNEGDKI